MKKTPFETIITILLILVTVLVLNPFGFWMPNMMVMSILCTVLVLFGVFTGFILREEKGDERESVHRALAGRNAFLIGSGLLILAICVQGLSHSVDPWLVIVFVSMIVTKMITRMWTDRNL